MNCSMMTNYQTAKRLACHVEVQGRLQIHVNSDRVNLTVKPEAERDGKGAARSLKKSRAGDAASVCLKTSRRMKTLLRCSLWFRTHVAWEVEFSSPPSTCSLVFPSPLTRLQLLPTARTGSRKLNQLKHPHYYQKSSKFTLEFTARYL